MPIWNSKDTVRLVVSGAINVAWNLKCCIHTRHNVPLVQIKMNRLTRHVSVDGQIVIRTCAIGSLKYHKHQDIEAEVEETMEKGLTQNLVATTMSSRYVGIRRRMEGVTMCSQDETTTHKEQEEEWVKGKGGGRQSLKHMDGDVSMCMRNKVKEIEED